MMIAGVECSVILSCIGVSKQKMFEDYFQLKSQEQHLRLMTEPPHRHVSHIFCSVWEHSQPNICCVDTRLNYNLQNAQNAKNIMIIKHVTSWIKYEFLKIEESFIKLLTKYDCVLSLKVQLLSYMLKGQEHL